MQIRILRDDAARAFLRSDELVSEWERLHAGCPWATVFQAPGFARAWYDVYAAAGDGEYRPVIVAGRDPAGRLCGLLPLAQRRGSRALVAAGAHQAEYQGWIAERDCGGDFGAAAFEALAREGLSSRLTLRYTPAGLPDEWRRERAATSGAFRAVRRPVKRPLIDLADLSGVEERLKGSLLKRSQKMLKRDGGEVRLERVDDREAAVALLDRMIPMYDLRQGARYGVLPFQDDARKLAFHRALLRDTDLLRVSVLRAGDHLASIRIDTRNGHELLANLFTHSPVLARWSPGALHNVLLAKEAAAEGWRTMDLSPGEGYKADLANAWDEVAIVDVLLGAQEYVAHAATRAVRETAKRAIGLLGERGGRWRERAVRGLALARSPGRAVTAARRWARSRDEVVLLGIDADTARRLAGAEPLARNDLPALVAYPRWPAPGAPSRATFLSAALERLEKHQTALTLARDGVPVVAAWVASGTRPVELPGFGEGMEIPEGAAVLYDVAAPDESRSLDADAAMRALVAGAAGVDPEARRVLIALPAPRADLVDAARRLGAVPAGERVRECRFGAVREWTTVREAPVETHERREQAAGELVPAGAA